MPNFGNYAAGYLRWLDENQRLKPQFDEVGSLTEEGSTFDEEEDDDDTPAGGYSSSDDDDDDDDPDIDPRTGDPWTGDEWEEAGDG